MRQWRFLILLVIAILLVLSLSVFVWQRLRADDFGPMVALCPGPDHYGYLCESGAAFAYINATHDTFLYELDGTTQVELPFPFTFYGTTYNDLTASVDGNVQFGNNSAEYANVCLDTAPAVGMGDMIAPYWDDLDLRFAGFLETELVGEEPNRILVIEWDNVPRYETDEPVTFEIQLFEGSNDIVFLYQNVTQSDGGHGRKATIGIQSEAQGLALQYGCDQAVVADASQVGFAHPENPNGEVGQETPPTTQKAIIPDTVKGPAAELLHQLNLRGEAALPDLHNLWISQSPPVTAVWERADITGDGQAELLVMRHSTFEYPHLSQLLLFSPDVSGQMSLLLDEPLSSRKQAVYGLTVAHIGDLTWDGRDDIVLEAPDTGHLFVLTAVFGSPTLLLVPEQCSGGLGVLDLNGDGRDDLVRDGCPRDGRVYTTWNGQSFATIQ